jgi:energy-coupling factor transport system ATP-binding protein
LENAGIARPEMLRRVDEALALVGLRDEKMREPHHLSGGQKQRLALAGILALMPEVIILDEATAMLDPMGRKEMLKTVSRLNKEKGITIIAITHFPEEALYADTIYVMEKGKVVLKGAPRDVLTQVEVLDGLGLDVPFAVRLCAQLKNAGLSLKADGLDEDELVEELWTSVLQMSHTYTP